LKSTLRKLLKYYQNITPRDKTFFFFKLLQALFPPSLLFNVGFGSGNVLLFVPMPTGATPEGEANLTTAKPDAAYFSAALQNFGYHQA